MGNRLGRGTFWDHGYVLSLACGNAGVMYKSVKTHWNLHLKSVLFTVYKLYINTVDFFEKPYLYLVIFSVSVVYEIRSYFQPSFMVTEEHRPPTTSIYFPMFFLSVLRFPCCFFCFQLLYTLFPFFYWR